MRHPRPLLRGALAALAFLALTTSTARAAVEVLDAEGLDAEMRRNEALWTQVRHSGAPDLAQRWRVHSDLPWDVYLVRLIYLDAGKELAFSRAFILGRPEIGLLRYRRPLSDELAAQTRQYLAAGGPAPTMDLEPSTFAGSPSSDLGPAERAEAAALRAETAAEMTELGAAAAEQAAARLERTTASLEDAFRKQLRK
jgi:hypothetical protein